MSWLTRSMLERVENEMEMMIREAGGVPSMYMNMAPESRISGHPQTLIDGGLSWQEGGNLPMDDADEGLCTLTATLGSDMEPSPTLVDEPPPFMDDNEDNETFETETDGSSVHTPTDGVPLESSPFVPSQAHPSSQGYVQSHRRNHATISTVKPTLRLTLPRTPSPPCSPPLSPPLPVSGGTSASTAASSSITISIPQPKFTSSGLAAYKALSGQRSRLQSLLSRIDNQQHTLACEERQLQTVLEVKSRRRAWTNRQYMGNDRAEIRFVGFSIPTKSSPLARAEPIVASDVVILSSMSTGLPSGPGFVEGVNGLEKLRKSVTPGGELVVTTAENNIMRLFPVCEEDEEEREDDCAFSFGYGSAPFAARISREDLSLEMCLGDQDAMGIYVDEMGVSSVRLVEDSILRDAEAGLLMPLPLQRHPVPIRPRTRSMLQHPPLSTPPLSCPPSPSSIVSSYSASEDEKAGLNALEPQTKVDLFDAYPGEDDDSDDMTRGELGFKSEFTLAMDLPPPYRMGVGVQAITRRYDNWIAGTCQIRPRSR